MRLLDVETHKFREFDPNEIPSYAILSHTWGHDEISYEDIALRQAGKKIKRKQGWPKIDFSCREAKEDGLQYVWVDTCCIDKRSSAELSEAINSMFAWYQRATVCYVYLSDLEGRSFDMEAFGKLRWFTRGWTLQELLAPQVLYFFSKDWKYVGELTKGDMAASTTSLSKSSHDEPYSLGQSLATITGIESDILFGKRQLDSVCIARRMSWASRRETTRPEDLAYCLLGIFDIHMPTIYGEGEKAFLRLQEEILKTSDDHSLFAWVATGAPPSEAYGLFASSPAHFSRSGNVIAFRDWTDTSPPHSVSNLGLSITIELHESSSMAAYMAVLNCAWSDRNQGSASLFLRRIPGTVNQYQRLRASKTFSSRPRINSRKTQIYVRQRQVAPASSDVLQQQKCRLTLRELGTDGDNLLHLSSFFHTELAAGSADWYRLLRDQKVSTNYGNLESEFWLPGHRATLSVALCFQTFAAGNIPGRRHSSRSMPPVQTATLTQVRNWRDARSGRLVPSRTKTQWLRILSREDAMSDETSRATNAEESRFLVLVGTDYDSHKPVFIPVAATDLTHKLEGLVARINEPDTEIGRQKHMESCTRLFTQLSELYRLKLQAMHKEPDRAFGQDICQLSVAWNQAHTNDLLECTLLISKPDLRLDRAVSDLSRTSQTQSESSQSDYWTQYQGPSTEAIPYENVFELE